MEHLEQSSRLIQAWVSWTKGGDEEGTSSNLFSIRKFEHHKNYDQFLTTKPLSDTTSTRTDATVKRRRHDHPWYPNGEPLLAIPSGNLIRGCVRLFTSCVPVRQLAIIFTKWSTGLTLSAFFLAGTLRRLFITATSRVVKMRGLSPVNKLERELGGFNNVRWSGPRRDFWRKHIKSVHEENWNGRVCQKTSTSFAQLL